MAPVTEPMSTNGVPPLKIRSPQNSTDRSGIQTIESLVVWAGMPTCRTSARRSPLYTASWSVKVTNGGSRVSSPQSTVPEPRLAGHAARDDLGPGPLVGDDRCAGEQAVPVGVVAVVVGVDHARGPARAVTAAIAAA